MRVSLFWHRSATEWFRQFVALVALVGFTMRTTRFNHALVGMDEETIEFISDVLEDFSYRRPNQQLIMWLSVSGMATFEQLLAELKLSDRAIVVRNQVVGWGHILHRVAAVFLAAHSPSWN